MEEQPSMSGIKPGGQWPRRYTTGDLAKTLNVSRASLMYYEQAGLVRPHRNPKTGTREYDNADIFDLVDFAALNNIGLSAKQVVSMAEQDLDLFGETRLEEYLGVASRKIAYYEALRESIDRMRAIRLRVRTGPRITVEQVEEHLFVEDGAEEGYSSFKTSAELEALIACVPIAGFGLLFELDQKTRTTSWRWGRTIPTRLAGIAGINQHFPTRVGGCACVTTIASTSDERTPLSAEDLQPLYERAETAGRVVAGEPFVPYVFPPHPHVPYLVCLPLE